MTPNGRRDAQGAKPALPAPGATDRGVVFDFTNGATPDPRDLALLVTARMLAERNERPVWVRALPHRAWEVLEAMGLAHLFRFFPMGSSGEN